MLQPAVAGRWLLDIGSYGDVSYVESAQNGCESARWSMPARTRHNDLRPGAPVVIYEGTQPVWSGYLTEPSRDGTMEAVGGYGRAAGVLALDSIGNPTTNPQVAVQAAITRGAVPWKAGRAFYNAALGDPDPTLTLAALLNRMTDATGLNWRVNHLGVAEDGSADTSPAWAVLSTERLASVADDDYATHLNVYYQTGAATYSSFIYSTPESAAAAGKWDRRERPLDLTEYGVITLATATAYAATELAGAGPRMALSESLTIVPGQLKTLGDTAAGWNGVHAGQMVRLWGMVDRTKTVPALHTDMVIGRLERTPTALTLAPLGLPPRNARDVVTAITSSASAPGFSGGSTRIRRTSWTPTFTSGATLGAGTATGWYCRDENNMIDFGLAMTFGAGMSITGIPSIALPLTGSGFSANAPNVTVDFVSAGSNSFRGYGFLGVSSVACYSMAAGGSGGAYSATSSTFPFIWKATDVIVVQGRYPGA